MPGRRNRLQTDIPDADEFAFYGRLAAKQGKSNAAWLRSVLRTLYMPSLAVGEIAHYPRHAIEAWVAAGLLQLIRTDKHVPTLLISLIHHLTTLDAQLTPEEQTRLTRVVELLEDALKRSR